MMPQQLISFTEFATREQEWCH